MKKELNRLQKGVSFKEKEIEDLETKIQIIDEKLAQSDIYNPENQVQLQELLSKKELNNQKLSEANDRWETLQIELESIQLQNSTD